jgi:hypothetical protein
MRWRLGLSFRPESWLSHDAVEKPGGDGSVPCPIGENLNAAPEADAVETFDTESDL